MPSLMSYFRGATLVHNIRGIPRPRRARYEPETQAWRPIR